MEKKNIALEVLEKELKTKKEKLNEINKKRFEESEILRKDLLKQYTNFLHDKIPSIIENNFVIETSTSGDSITFKSPHPEVSYDKEVFTVYLERSNYDKDYVDKVRLNYYTTWGEDDFELTRLMVMGKVAEFVLCEDNKQFLLDIYNNQPEPSITYTDVRKVEKEYEQIKDQIDTLKKEAKWYKFETEGVKFDSTTIEYNIGSLIYDCVGMRLVKYTNKNKKTATIEFTRQTYTHDSRGKRVENPEVEVVCIDKIRVSNLKYIVNHYVKDVC